MKTEERLVGPKAAAALALVTTYAIWKWATKYRWLVPAKLNVPRGGVGRPGRAYRIGDVIRTGLARATVLRDADGRLRTRKGGRFVDDILAECGFEPIGRRPVSGENDP